MSKLYLSLARSSLWLVFEQPASKERKKEGMKGLGTRRREKKRERKEEERKCGGREKWRKKEEYSKKHT